MDGSNETAQLPLPPLPQEVAKLITIYPIDVPDYNIKMNKTIEIYTKLQERFNAEKKRTEISLGGTEHFSKGPPKNAPPYLKFAFTKLIKMIHNHRIEDRRLRANVCTVISVCILFFEVLVNQNVPGAFDFNGFQEYIRAIFKKNEKYQKLYRRIKLLQNFCNIHQKELETPPENPVQVLCNDIVEQSKYYSHMYSYCPPNPYDSKIENYYVSEGKLSDFNQIILDISGRGEKLPQKSSFLKRTKWNQPRTNPNSLNLYINQFFEKQTAKNNTFDDKQKASFRASLLRIVFNSLYIETNGLLTPEPEFQLSAYIIMRLTPTDMNMPNIFTLEEKTMPFLDLFNAIPKLQLISEKLSFIHFYTNPLDIAFDICSISLLIDEFASDRSPTKEVIKLAFDDFFIILVVCICSVTIINPEGIRYYCEMYRPLEVGQLMSHSMTSLAAAIKYVKEFRNQEHPSDIQHKIDKILAEYK